MFIGVVICRVYLGSDIRCLMNAMENLFDDAKVSSLMDFFKLSKWVEKSSFRYSARCIFVQHIPCGENSFCLSTRIA